MKGKYGQRYAVLATEALSEMEDQQMKNRLALLQIAQHARSPDDSMTRGGGDQVTTLLFIYCYIYFLYEQSK